MSKPLTLRERILNIIKEVNPDEALEHYVSTTSLTIALAVLPEDKDKLIEFAKVLNMVGSSTDHFHFVTLSKSLRDTETTANPRGLLLNIPSRLVHTHIINGYYFVKLGNFKTVNLQKIAITL
jgi:hypothetical protein